MNGKKYQIRSYKIESDYNVWIEFEDHFSGQVNLSNLLEKHAFAKIWSTYEAFNPHC